MKGPDGTTRTAFAHSREGEPEERWEPLPDHLERVARLAGGFAEAFGASPWGTLAGLWHDLGKYRPEFQRRLRGSAEQVEHAGVGAALGRSKDRSGAGLALAFAIAGHHAGLANLKAQGDTSLTPLLARIADNESALREVLTLAPQPIVGREIPSLPLPLQEPAQGTHVADDLRRSYELWVRFLFSALIDADRLATQAFYEPNARASNSRLGSIGELARELDAHLATLTSDGEVGRVRAQVLADCRAASQIEPGLFSLTAPTGAGKTLSSMAFALSHALYHGLQRVIVVVPYTSIIEQNAAVYRRALGAQNVIEHHSALDEPTLERADRETEIRRRLATENWDAPVIVTTTVQFYETLFSNRPAVCRKLHNVARAVVILDEAQTLPTGFLSCLLDAFRDLAGNFGSSIVVSTATQPALGRRETLPRGLENVREIVSDPGAIARALDRVRISWPDPDAAATPYLALASELASHERVLAIVHLRKDARALAELLPEKGRFHLSALMCPAHRLQTIQAVDRALRKDETCRVVATQLVEAGVNLDFPVVYRALAGFDSLAQAAGRCNREGHKQKGDFRVFRAETQPPAGTLRLALESAEALLRRHGEHLNFVEGSYFEEFFRMLYAKCEHDRKGVQAERAHLNFATVGELMHVIEDGFTTPVVAPWGDGPERLAALASMPVPTREALRALQPFIVQLRENDVRRLRSIGALDDIHEVVSGLSPPFHQLYSPEFGLVVKEDARPDVAALIVSS